MGTLTIGKLIKQQRHEKEMTQKQLSMALYRLGEKERTITTKTMFISAIERDQSHLPDYLIVDVARILTIPVETIVNLKIIMYSEKLRKLTAKSK